MIPMDAPTPAAPSPKTPAHRRFKAGDTRSWNLSLEAAGTAVPLRMAADSPTLMVAAVEDLCWQLAASALQARRPHRWRRTEWTAWRAERDRVAAKRDRVAAMTRDAVNEL